MPDEPKPEGPRYQGIQTTGHAVQGTIGHAINVMHGLSPDQLQMIVQAATEGAQRSHKESIAHIASELDSTREVVRTFLRIIGEPGVPPERFSEALLSAATQYRAMHDAVHGSSKDDGSTQRILDEVADLRQKLESIASRAETNPSGVDKERGEGLVRAEQAFSRISAGVRQNQEQIEQGISQSRGDSSKWFWLTLCLTGAGTAIILMGILMLLLGLTMAGSITTAAAALPNALSLILFRKDKELRETTDGLNGRLLSTQGLLSMIDLAETLTQPAKDEAKLEIMRVVIDQHRKAVPRQRTGPPSKAKT